MLEQPKICRAYWPYFQKLLKYHGLEVIPTHSDPSIWGGDQQKILGFDEYNFLLDINLCFSSRPTGLVRDQTDSIRFPFLTQSLQRWKVPDQNFDLETCFFNRVQFLESRYPVINLLWSGGIDSTAMAVAFLKFSTKKTKIRILYTPDSIKENVEFFLHLRTIKHIELIEMGGNVFHDNDLDGVEIHGGTCDDLTASVDESFFKKYQWWNLQSSWKDFFWKKIQNHNFIDFCDKWFALSGREITTVLHARWWFYFNKTNPGMFYVSKTNPPAANGIVKKNYAITESFFNDSQFTAHFYHNIDSLFGSTAWNSYKQTIKNFIHDYYPDSNYQKNKCKEHSGGATILAWKKKFLKKTEEICYLQNGVSIYTDNLPFLSKIEYRRKYGEKLNYLFNP